MKREVRISLSVGAIVLAVLHAVLLAIVFQGLHATGHSTKPLPLDFRVTDTYAPNSGDYFTASPDRMLPPVNAAARDEVKQGGTVCPECDIAEAQQTANGYGANIVAVRDFRRNSVQVYASLPDGRRWVASGKSTTATYVGRNAYAAVLHDMRLGVASVDVPQSPRTPSPTPSITPTPVTPAQPTAKKYQLALFVTDDSQSQQLLEWFSTDQELINLRSRCEFQVYTPQNALYQARYAQAVPIDQFPAMLFLKSDGGHIHAAGKSMLPGTSKELVSDLRQSYELARSAEAAPMQTGMIRETGYNWDAAINPQMRLQSGDCPDGFCPDDSSRLPGLGGGSLLDRVRKPAEAVIWTGAAEIATVMLIGLAGVLVVVIVLKRR